MPQPSLFLELALEPPPSKPRPMEIRRAKIKAAFENADERWRKAYEAFILEYGKTHSPFSAEDTRLAFKSDKTNPTTHAEQGAGGVFQRLVRAGKLIPVGFKPSAIYGNNLRTYRIN